VIFAFFAGFMTNREGSGNLSFPIFYFSGFKFKQQSMDYNKIPKVKIESAKDFITTLPQSVPQEYLEEVDTNFHFDIEGEGGGQFSVIVKDNNIEVLEHFEGEPNCVIKAKEENFIKLLRGELNPMMAVFSGKLKVSDTGEVMKYAKIFGLM
jgi:putative sterol carrier protein